MYDIETMGQVFTPEWIVHKMIDLRQNDGSVLEPSTGDGAFMRHLEPEAIGIELDETHINDPRVRHQDFFNLTKINEFSTIIGNPPYVRSQSIRENTRDLLRGHPLNGHANLYLFFIWRCIDLLSPGGEMIFITPREFLKATGAAALNHRLYREGSFTYFEDLGDQKIFNGFSPNCAIWRWVKGLDERRLDDGRVFHEGNGQIWFGRSNNGLLSDHFEVKVGAVSGADQIFTTQQGKCRVCMLQDTKNRQQEENDL